MCRERERERGRAVPWFCWEIAQEVASSPFLKDFIILFWSRCAVPTRDGILNGLM